MEFHYYVTVTGRGFYRLRQIRFSDLAKEHPHDVCAVSGSLDGLKQMMAKISKQINWEPQRDKFY